jgi:hypothetical protein
MGMYTELVCAFELKQTAPKEMATILRAMTVGDVDYLEDLEEKHATPNHALFSTYRWKFMLRCDSYYFDGDTSSTIRYDDIAKAPIVTIRCNLKNYDQEIEKFIDWVKPHIQGANGNYFIGYSRYEEDDKPTLIFV